MEECMATSMTEAEYVAMSDTTKETLWLGQLAYTFRQADPNSVPVLFGDNQGVVTLTKNMVHHNASKHIEVQYHFVRDYVTKGKLDLMKVSIVDNVANRVTKCLSDWLVLVDSATNGCGYYFGSTDSCVDESAVDFSPTTTKVVVYNHLVVSVFFVSFLQILCNTPITWDCRIHYPIGQTRLGYFYK